jgi:hypothetical protein
MAVGRNSGRMGRSVVCALLLGLRVHSLLVRKFSLRVLYQRRKGAWEPGVRSCGGDYRRSRLGANEVCSDFPKKSPLRKGGTLDELRWDFKFSRGSHLELQSKPRTRILRNSALTWYGVLAAGTAFLAGKLNLGLRSATRPRVDQTHFLISRVVSMGRRNTFLKFTRRSLKT